MQNTMTQALVTEEQHRTLWIPPHPVPFRRTPQTQLAERSKETTSVERLSAAALVSITVSLWGAILFSFVSGRCCLATRELRTVTWLCNESHQMKSDN